MAEDDRIRPAAAGSESVPVLEVHARTVATLVCQRCLQPLHLPLSSTSRVGLVMSMGQADRLPAEVEPVWAEGRKVDLGVLVVLGQAQEGAPLEFGEEVGPLWGVWHRQRCW